MSDQVLILATAILIALSAFGLGYSVRRLRREPRLSARTWLLGAGVPPVATLGYLLLGGPPFHILVVLVMFAVGVAGTSVIGVVRSGSGGPAAVAHQTGVTLAIWAVVYVLAALTAFIPRADSQALMAVLLALCAGLAAGTQIGLAVRARQGAVRITVLASAGGPPTSWQQPADQPPAAVAPAPGVAQPAPPIATPAPIIATSTPPAVTPPIGSPPPVGPPPAPVAQPTDVPSPALPPPVGPPPAPAPEPVHFTHSGGRFLFGYTSTYVGIWDLANRQGAQAQYPRTHEGRVAAWSQFAVWEPRSIPVMPYPGLALEPIADVPVSFSHVGPRFAFGHTATEHAIWDRWAPGPPAARFGVDPQGAALAWQTFMAWEPAAMQL